MKTYQLQADIDNYKWVIPKYDGDFKILDNLRGQSVKKEWNTLQLEYIVEKGDEELMQGDFPNLCPGCLIFSEMAVNLLLPLIKEEVELLDVAISGEKGRFFLVNVIKVLDCLDLENSNIVRFSNGKIMTIKKFAFLENVLNNANIFRIKNAEKEIIVSQLFYNLIKNSTLKGFKFKDTLEEEENMFSSIFKKNPEQKRQKKKN